jgi:hypothetical protein
MRNKNCREKSGNEKLARKRGSVSFESGLLKKFNDSLKFSKKVFQIFKAQLLISSNGLYNHTTTRQI